MIDDDGPSRSSIPRTVADHNGAATAEKATQDRSNLVNNHGIGETRTSADESRLSSDLPADVRVKLRKLEKLESRYYGT